MTALCRFRRLARERQVGDRERLMARGYTFREDEADRVVTLFERYLRHHKGEWAGQPFDLEDWQKDEVLRPLFGWFRPDGTRRFRVAYIEIPRKNGKTELAAGIGVYLTGPDGEPGAEVYTIATKEKQARICFDAAKAMIRRSAELAEVFDVLRSNVSCVDLESKLEPLGRDSATQDGLNAHGILADEMHAHKDRHLFDVLQTSTGARRQPLTLIITTAGVYDPASIGWELHDYAVKVLEGAVQDDTFFAYITAADEDDDWRQPATWRKANPNLGVSVKEEYLATECARAQQSPAYENTFRRYHLNQWTQQVTRWIAMEAWNACPNGARPDLAGRSCFAGLDLSTKIDVTALALVFPPTEDGGAWDLLFRFWVPEEMVAERTRLHRLPDYRAWVQGGHLITTPGNVIDYQAIRAEVARLARQYSIVEIAFDPWNASQISVDLQSDGYTMAEMRQGYRSLSEPSKMFEAMVLSRRLRHMGHPVMRWMVSNVTVRTDPNGNIAPDKSTAAGKIDGVVATIMGLGRAIVAEPAIEAGVLAL